MQVKALIDLDVELYADNELDARSKIEQKYPGCVIKTLMCVEDEFKAGDIFINPANNILFQLVWYSSDGFLLFKVTKGLNLVGKVGPVATLEKINRTWGSSDRNALVHCPWEHFWQTVVEPAMCKARIAIQPKSPKNVLDICCNNVYMQDLKESVKVYV